MPRKQWSAQTELTTSLIKSREKRKWQIALRRYVLDKNPCINYAPFFGLDIENFRKWIEMQFETGTGWDDFGKKWQFEHVIPVNCFNFSNKTDLKMCWNFLNIRAEHLQENEDAGGRMEMASAKKYFQELYNTTNYPLCLQLLGKIEQMETSQAVNTTAQQTFILQNKDYLNTIEHYSGFEFELLNSGRSIEEVKKEAAFLKKFK